MTIGNSNSTDQSPDPGHNTEMLKLATQVLEAASAAMVDSLAIQSDMASLISAQIRALKCNPEDKALRTHINTIVSALQYEDNLRQRHEHLIQSFNILTRALGAPAQSSNGQTGNATPAEWRQLILDVQLLPEMKQEFSKAFRMAQTQTEKPDAETDNSDDVILF